MSKGPKLVPGQARTCPICKATILESASICPACRHHLRFDSRAAPRREWDRFVPLRVESTIHHPPRGEGWEYSILLVVRDENGDEVARQVLGVGAIQPRQERTFTLEVEVLTPMEAEAAETG